MPKWQMAPEVGDSRQPYVPKTLEESMAEEMASGKYGPLDRLAIGVKSGLDKYAYGLKSLFTPLSEEEQIAQSGRVAGSTKMGKAGQIIGNMAVQYPLYGALGAATAPLSPTAQLAANIAGSGAIGAGTGALTSPENRGQAALASGAGAATGAALMGGLTGPFAPRTGSVADALVKQGVPLTPGQAAGGVVKSIEDTTRMINPSVARRQQEAIGGWNRVEVNKMLSNAGIQPIEEKLMGHDLLAEAQRRISAAYEAAGTKQVLGDRQYFDALDNLQQKFAPFLKPDEATALQQTSEVARRMAGGQKNTDAFRAFENDLAPSKSLTSNANAANKELQREMEALRGRLGNATPDLDLSNAKFNLLKEAAAGRGSLDTGIVSPGQLRGPVAQAATTTQAATGRGLMQKDVAAAQTVLGDTIPRIGPGTAEKGFWLGTIPAAGAASVYTGNPLILGGWLGALAGNKLAYTPQGVRFLTGQYPWQGALSEYGALGPAIGSAGAQEFQARPKRKTKKED